MLACSQFTIHRFVVNVNTLNKPINLYCFGDVHRFAKGCAEEKWLEFLEIAKKDTNALFLGMGDYDDLASESERAILINPGLHDDTRWSVDDVYDYRVKQFHEEIKFMKYRLIGLLEGNHYGIYSTGGMTTTQKLCETLRCRYLGVNAFIRMSFICGSKRNAIDIFAHHGKGAARLIGGSLNGVEQMVSNAEADIYLCLTGDTKVVLESGITELKNVQKGDRILDSNCQFQEVLDTFKREVNGVYQLTILGAGQPLRATSEHPILSLKKDIDIIKKVTKVNTTFQIVNEPSYHTIEQLDKDDWVYIPIPKDIKNPPKRFLNIEFDKDVARFIGLYLAEGNIRENGVQFSFHQKEIEFIDFIKSMAKKMGIDAKEAFIENNKVIMILLNSKRLMLEMLKFGRGAHSKRFLPEMLFYPKELQQEFIRGVYQGDGCPIKKRPGAFIMVTVSSELAYQLAYMLLRQGEFPSVKMRNSKLNGKNFAGYTISFHQGTTTKKRLKLHIPYKDGILARIKEKCFDKDRVSVYNLSVSFSNSFIANLVATHNCGHDHQRNAGKVNRLHLQHGGDGLILKDKTMLLARTGSFLRGYIPDHQSYVVKGAMKPSDIGYLKIILTPTREARLNNKTRKTEDHLTIKIEATI